MNPREKMLAIAAFALTAAAMGFFILFKVIIAPTQQANKTALELQAKVDEMEGRIAIEPSYRAELRETIARSYGDESAAGANLRAHLMRVIAKASLSGDDVTISPVRGKTIRGGREIGWNVQVRGSLEKLTSLLFLLQKDPHLHRLDTLAWQPIQSSPDLELTFRLMTLVLEPVEGEKAVKVEPEKLENKASLEGKDRKAYGLIPLRNVFLPYIKKPPAPPVRVVEGRRPEPRDDGPSTPPVKPPPAFQLVGLPSWEGKPEIVVKNLDTKISKIHKIGEDLLGGEIVMVDYRPLPLPKKPLLLSESRVIVMIGPEYWAVELGHLLTDKYRVTPDRLPPGLPILTPPKSPNTPQASGLQAVPPAPTSAKSTDDSEFNGSTAPAVSGAPKPKESPDAP